MASNSYRTIQILLLGTFAGLFTACGRTNASASIKDFGIGSPSCPTAAGEHSDDDVINKVYARMLQADGMRSGYTPALIQLHSDGAKDCITWSSISITGTKGVKLRLAPESVKGYDEFAQMLVTKSAGKEVLNLATSMTRGDSQPIYFQAIGPETGGVIQVTGKYLSGTDETTLKLEAVFVAPKLKKDILKDGSANELRMGFGATQGATASSSGSGSGSGSAEKSAASGTGSASGSASS